MKRKKTNTIINVVVEKGFYTLLWGSAILILVIVLCVLYSLVKDSSGAFKEYGFFKFIFSKEWNPTTGREHYGALPFIMGTLYTSGLALIIAIPFSLPVALFTGEYFRNTRIASVFSAVVDMLAGVPSIVFGLWGFFVIRPLIIQMGWSDQGVGLFAASVVLAIMIIPYATSLSSEFISMVPNDLKEAAYALGATRFEMIRHVLFSSAGSGIFASFILALGRALGETMAVTMLIGNTNSIPSGLFDTGNSMASLIANQFGEASTGSLKLSSLMAIALLLFIITALINAAGRMIMKRLSK